MGIIVSAPYPTLLKLASSVPYAPGRRIVALLLVPSLFVCDSQAAFAFPGGPLTRDAVCAGGWGSTTYTSGVGFNSCVVYLAVSLKTRPHVDVELIRFGALIAEAAASLHCLTVHRVLRTVWSATGSASVALSSPASSSCGTSTEPSSSVRPPALRSANISSVSTFSINSPPLAHASVGQTAQLVTDRNSAALRSQSCSETHHGELAVVQRPGTRRA